MKYLELFAGCGGLALGLEKAGLTPTLLVDNDKDCVQTLKNNIQCSKIIQADVRNLDYSDAEADVLVGGFPCQPFSHAGKREGFLDSVRGTLFYEIVRCALEVRPKLILLENVKGLITHDSGRTLITIINTLESIGYAVEYRVLNAADYNVPQNRERVIIIASEKSIHFPEPNVDRPTLRSFLSNVPTSPGVKYNDIKTRIMDMVPQGKNWKSLPVDIQKEYLGKAYYSGGGRTGFAKRLSLDSQSPTLTCSPAQKQTERCHPTETRPLTIREYARIQTFPDSYVFSGGVTSQYRQIGNAVPVNLAYALGLSIIKSIG